MKINLKLALIILELTLIPFFMMEFIAYSNSRSQLDSQIIGKLEAIASIQKSRLEEVLQSNLSDLDILTHDPDLIQGTANYSTGPSALNQGFLQDILNKEKTSISSIREISIAGVNGKIIASTSKNSVGVDISGFTYFQTGEIKNQASDFSKDHNGLVSLTISGPIISGGKVVGVLLVNTTGSDVGAVVSSYDGLGSTGETLLVTKNKNGDTVFLTPIRFDPNAALNRIISKDKTTIPSTHASNGEEINMLNATDYSGIPVIAVTKYIPDANWGIVAKISQSEAYSPIKSMADLLAFMGIASGIIIILISASVARSFTDPIQELTAFADRVGQGDLSQRVTIKTRDEFGILGRVFNQTVAKLQESYRELEAKVAERTEALSKNVRDLEEEKRASLNILEDLDLEKTKYEALIESIGDGVIATDNEAKIIFINSSAKKMLGVGLETVGGSLNDALLIVDKNGEPIPLESRPFNIAITTKKSFSTSVESDYYYVSKEGKKFPVALVASPIVSNNRLIGVIDIFRDISHEKEVDRMKTEFVSLASHQLRTPLTAIKWGLEILVNESENLTPRQKTYLNDIDSSNERMIDLVNSLLNISRIESGRIMINPVPTNIVKLANDVIGKLKMEIAKKGITLVLNIADNIPEINLDYNLIFNVYQNLISNAVSYSPSGSKVVFSIEVKDGEILSSVKDSGIGIPEDEKKHIFEKFYRASNAKQVRPDGSGLGLYIVKSIVESSGGKMWFESVADQGTTFFFTLPLSGMKPKEGQVTIS